MKLWIRLASLFVLAALALAWPRPALAQDGPEGAKYVLGGTYTLESGQSLNGNLVVLGGVATIEEGATVEGSAWLMGGTLEVKGNLRGDVVAAGGLVSLAESAEVGGDVNLAGAHLERAAGAQIGGEVRDETSGAFPLALPGVVNTPGVEIQPDPFRPLLSGLWLLFRSFLWAALAVLVVLFLPRQAERAGQAVSAQPVIAGGLGLLTVVALPVLLVVIALTLILIPVSLLGFIVLGVTWALGVIVMGAEAGRRIEDLFKQNWALPVSAGIGTFLLTLVANSVQVVLPGCLDWVLPMLIGVLGVGALLLTRFGTQPYPAYGSAPVIPPPAPPNPAPLPPTSGPTRVIDEPPDIPPPGNSNP